MHYIWIFTFNLIVSFSFLFIRPSMKLPKKIQQLQMTEIREFFILFYFDWPILLCLDLSTTDTWMEKLINKKQKKDSTLVTPSSSIPSINSVDDPCEEITHWFKTKWLDRAACPDPIAWWGVCVSLIIFKTCPNIQVHFSISLNIQSSNWWHTTTWRFQWHHALLSAHFLCQHGQMTHIEVACTNSNLVAFRNCMLGTLMVE